MTTETTTLLHSAPIFDSESRKPNFFSLVMQMATHPSKVCDMKQENAMESIQMYPYCCLGVCGPIVDIQLRSLGFLLQAMS